ncbi:MAG: hypothetical protein ACOCUL_00035 [Bacteroidota bacterium]
MKKIFIHIGIPKTGTTSIQHSLYSNREILFNNGYLYPKSLPENHSLPLFFFFQNIEKLKNNKYQLQKIKDNSNPDYETIINSFLNELNESKDVPNIIISGEAILTLKEQHLKIMQLFFKDVLPSHQIRIICFVRNPVDFMKSLTQQRVRVGKAKVTIEKNLLKKRINPFIKVFGQENVSIHKYEDAVNSDFGIIGYFLKAIDFPEESINNFNPVFQNTSISYQAYEIINFITEQYKCLYEAKNSIEKNCGNLPFALIKGTNFYLNREEQKFILRIFKNDLKWLKKKLNVEYKEYKTDINSAFVLKYDRHFEVEFIEAFKKVTRPIQYLAFLFVMYKKETIVNKEHFITFNNIYKYLNNEYPELYDKTRSNYKNVKDCFMKYQKKMNSKYPNLTFTRFFH